MNAFSFFSHSPSSFFIYFLLTAIFQLSYAHGDDDIHFASCAPFDCGSLVNISYPFWTDHLNRPSSYCGFGDPGYKLNCNPNQPPVVTLSSQDFQVVNLNQSRGLLTIKRVELNTCPQEILINDVFNYSDTAQKITLFYDCRSRGVQNHSFSCRRDGRDRLLPAVFLRDDGNECVGSEKVEIPVGETALDGLMNGFTALNESLLQPFDIKYYAYENSCKHCKDSGGRCGSNETLPSAFVCYCRDRPHQLQCSHGKSDFNGQRKPAIVAAGGIIQIISSIFFCVRSRRRRGKNFKSSNAPCKRPSNLSSMIDPETVSSMIDPETGYNLVGSHVFTCKELEEATNGFHFRMLLGEGGFGSVYFGKLQDGRAVAVKRLYENNDKRVKQFMNEVEILTRLRHSNLITLYGCTSGHSRELLLVYEYVPNGTVADHLHGRRAKPGALSCSTRLDIAIGTATALCYLHASDIIHRDVKTNNILLDDNFGVKVADFGLSRPFPTDVTHVSTAPQGTPGYVDPKYHTCCQVTYKSDVYSFGVVLIELISSKPAIDFRRHRELISSQPAVDITRHRDEIFLSYIAINKILNRAIHELVDPSLGFESDKKVREMITGVAAVAFQCLQNVKDMRPTMAQVLEALTAVKNKYSNKAK